MKEIVERVKKYLEDNFQGDEGELDKELSQLEDVVFLYIIVEWLTNKYKIVVSAKPSIDPKYNQRLWYTIGLYEWSRSHEFWMNKSGETRYYDDTITALGYGLLQGLEIAKIKFIDKKDI